MNQPSKDQDIANSILFSRCSEHEWDVIANIIDILEENFGIPSVDSNDEPIPLDELLTKDILENRYDEILENLPSDNEYHDHLNHMVLGALIIDKKAKMPKELREGILHAISWDAELKWRWKNIDKVKQKEFLEERKNLIESFKQVIVDYPSNKI